LAYVGKFIATAFEHSHSMLDGTSNARESRIHVFCDASEKTYRAALYIGSTSWEGIIVRLVCSKAELLQWRT